MTAPTVDTVARPASLGYGVALNDRLFRLAVGPGRELQIQTAPLQAPRVNTASSPEESGRADEFSLTFARSSFDGGEGLFRAHTEDAEPNRYWDSHNVSVRPAEPGEFPSIRLLHTTSVTDSSTATGIRMATDGSTLWRTEGTTLRRTTNPSASTPAWSADDPHAGETATTVADVAVLGDEVYAALGANGIHRKTSGSWAHWSDVLAERVWSVKGRIVASDGDSLYEVTASGAAPTATLILASGDEWNDVADGGSHVLAAATDGHVYAFSTDTGSLVLAGQTLFEGEQPTAVGQSQGIVAVGTRSGNVGRLYVGALHPDNGQLVDLQLVKVWGESGTATEQIAYRIVGTRASLVTAVTDGTDTSLWRFDLITGGLSRHLTVDGEVGAARGLTVLAGVPHFAIDGAGAFKEADTYVADGYLIGPLGDFYDAGEKTWVGARLETGEIVGAVELYYTTDPDALNDPDSSSWKRVVRRDSGTGDPGEHAISSVVNRSMAGMVKLYASGDASGTPEVRSFSFRAYPASGNEEKIILIPVNVSDTIERPGRSRIDVPGRGAREFDALRSFEGTSVKVRLYRPDMTLRGLVEEVGTPVQAITRRGSVTVVSQLRVRGRETGTGITSGAGPFGTDRPFGTELGFGEAA